MLEKHEQSILKQTMWRKQTFSVHMHISIDLYISASCLRVLIRLPGTVVGNDVIILRMVTNIKLCQAYYKRYRRFEWPVLFGFRTEF